MKHQYLAQGLYIAERNGEFLLQQETDSGMQTIDVLSSREAAEDLLSQAARVQANFAEYGITGARE